MVNGQIVIRPIMVVALTYDHRLLDGREAVTFLGASYFSICGSFSGFRRPFVVWVLVLVLFKNFGGPNCRWCGA